MNGDIKDEKSGIKRSSLDHSLTPDGNNTSATTHDGCIQCVDHQGLVPSSSSSSSSATSSPIDGSFSQQQQQQGPMAIVPYHPSTPPSLIDNNTSANGRNPPTPPQANGPRPDEQFIHLTEDILNLPQSEAARKLGVPTSSLSKKWKEVAGERKWPYRTICKLDKEIATLIEANTDPNNPQKLLPEVEHSLSILIRRRALELRTVSIRMRKKDLGLSD
jgi:hypothetical protein